MRPRSVTTPIVMSMEFQSTQYKLAFKIDLQQWLGKRKKEAPFQEKIVLFVECVRLICMIDRGYRGGYPRIYFK